MKSLFALKNTVLPALVLGFALSTPLSADDIEVFDTGSGVKPNILFVFDRSGSMERDVYGNETSVDAERRSSILREAFSQLLDANKDRINVGLGSFYRSEQSGVKWPIGDLNQNANEIDSDIPATAGVTSLDVIGSIFDNNSDWGDTNIVDALYESVLYYRGDEVVAGGGSWDGRFRPDVWNAASGKYEGGEYRAPNPATYTPSNAYEANATPLPDETGTCRDFSIGGTVIGNNECADSSYTRYDACSLVGLQVGSGTRCSDWEYVCHTKNLDGTCTDSTNTCKAYVPRGDTPAHNLCTWHKENRSAGKWNGANYKSPITDSCQANTIILLSDGDPTRSSAKDEIKQLTGVASCEDLSGTIFSTADPADANDGDCGLELVKFANETDQLTSVDNSIVQTYTIGFGEATPGQDYLRELANAGGGDFYAATDADQLTAAFDNIIDSISGDAETFTALAVDVNSASFSNDNRAFLSLFAPSGKDSWQGNLKGYFIDQNGLTDVDGVPAIINGPNGAAFTDTARSFWSSGIDGNEVLTGGVVSNLDPANRNLYTFTGSYIPTGGSDLTLPDNELIGTNDKIVPAMLQGQDRAIVDWVRTAPIADPLHTQPLTIKYENRTVAYMMTNQGLLHAFDATTPTVTGDHTGGSELWAFMPQALMANIPTLEANLSTGEHVYGLDGGMTRWLDESGDPNGIVETGEDAILYLGMRRGGSHYYAIDVSNPLKPKLKWRIDAGTAKFKQLGESWSRMSLVTMKVASTNRKVLVFGGGYDNSLDDSQNRSSLNAAGQQVKGNDIFLVDAETGAHIWSANNNNTISEMRYAIPSDINVIDSDGDGLADRAYVGDLGGQLWRLDFIQGSLNNSNGVTVTRLADLGSDTSFQPFFFPPSVALMENKGVKYLSIAIGSGNRDNPLNATSQNAMFMVKDRNIAVGAPASTAGLPVDLSDMYNATANLVASTDTTVATAAQDLILSKEGWYIVLSAGEKVLAESNTLQGQLHFTTFAPDNSASANTDPCVATGTIGRYYRMDAVDAKPVENLDKALGDTDATPLNKADRSTIVSNHGIPGPVTMVFPPDSNTIQVYVDRQKVSEVTHKLVSVYWYENN